MSLFCRLSVRGLTYNNNAGQLAIEYLRPDATSQFSKRTYPTVGQLRQHVASQVHRETTLPSPDCEAAPVTARRRHCPNPKPDHIPTFTGAVSYVYNDVAKVLFCNDIFLLKHSAWSESSPFTSVPIPNRITYRPSLALSATSTTTSPRCCFVMISLY